jgi:membrane protease YdiL (CAAX protease family)
MFVTASVVALALVQMWLFTPLFGPVRWIAALTVVAMVALSAWSNWRETGSWGLASGPLRPGLRWALLLTLPAVAGLLLLGRELGTLQVSDHLALRFVLLLGWALTQQFILQTVVLRETTARLGRRAGLWLTAALFAVLHLPNPVLTPVTFVAALGWCWVYDRYPNLIPVALSHACASLSLLIALGPHITGGMHVGYGYFLAHGSWI